MRRIRAATQRIIQGDFSVRIEPLHGPERADAFDAIIEDFNQMARELSGVETLRTDFIANVSHELKNAVGRHPELRFPVAGPCPAERAARRICQGRHRCIPPPGGPDRQYSQTEQAGKSADLPQAETYDLGEQLRECLLGFEDAWEAKELAVEADIPDGVAVRTDRELLTLVWNNLFSNAVKFTDAGGSIHVFLRHTGTQAEVCVTDTGCRHESRNGTAYF